MANQGGRNKPQPEYLNDKDAAEDRERRDPEQKQPLRNPGEYEKTMAKRNSAAKDGRSLARARKAR